MLTWTGALAAHAALNVTYFVTVKGPGAPGDKILTTSVSSSASVNCTTTVPCVNTVVGLIPGLTVATTADVATTTPGAQVFFTITITNTGQAPYPETTLNTDLTNVLDDADLTGDITASIGVVTYTNSIVSWAGTMHVPDSVTHVPDSGHHPLCGDHQEAGPG